MGFCERAVRNELYLFQKRRGLFMVGARVSGRWDQPYVASDAEAPESEDESETATIIGIMHDWQDDAIFDLSGVEGIIVQHDAEVAWSGTDPVRFTRIRVFQESPLRREDLCLCFERDPDTALVVGYWLRQQEDGAVARISSLAASEGSSSPSDSDIERSRLSVLAE